MPTTNNIDLYAQLITLNEENLQSERVSADVKKRVLRIRALYSHWISNPTLTTREMLAYHIEKHNVKRTQAYSDLRLTQMLLGEFQSMSRDFMRWKINQDLEHDLAMARKAEDWKSVAALENARIKNNLTDKQDDIEQSYDAITPQHFIPSSDPSVIGIRPIPDLRERMAQLKEKYSKE